MAAMNPVQVPCPECGEKVDVEIETTSEFTESDGLLVILRPNIDKMAEHYAQEHCGQEVGDG